MVFLHSVLRQLSLIVVFGLFWASPAYSADTTQPIPSTDIKKQAITMIHMQTNQGMIKIELNAEAAPNTVANFIKYAQDGFYDGTIFHRVINNFMVQGGGFDKDYKEKATNAPIRNEAKNGLKNDMGTVAMARTGDPHSATAQFFININDNSFLNAPGQDGWGYAVFGKVVDGMDVINKIKDIPTGSGGMFSTDVPKTMVIIEKVTVAE